MNLKTKALRVVLNVIVVIVIATLVLAAMNLAFSAGEESEKPDAEHILICKAINGATLTPEEVGTIKDYDQFWTKLRRAQNASAAKRAYYCKGV